MPVVPPLPTDAYPGFDDLCEYMQRVAEAVPHLVRLYTIGDSFEGRPLLLAEVTNVGTGPAEEKPALWVDGNSRAGEVAGSMACLAVLQRLASGHGRDEWVTSLLDTRAFYLLPRMAPDGAEHILTTGEFVPGSRRAEAEDSLRGLIPGDVNGDGRILQMRVEDPRGEWKASRRDPRLMLRRSPDDRQGPFYRLYREGHVEAHLGGPVHVAPPAPDRDLARNFPGGAADPLSEPESRAVADFLRTHRNLGAALSLRSSDGRVTTPAAAMAGDAALFRHFAARASEITGHPAAPAPVGGDFVDWAYDRLGLLAMTFSMWSLPRAAGLEVSGEERSETELLAILRWLDRERGGDGFHPWTLFQHPQLGRVEIGGWDLLTTWLNPPPGDDLAEECRRATELALALAASLPRLQTAEFREEQVGWADSEDGTGDDELAMPLPLRKVVLEVANEGYLPTWLTEAGRQHARAALAQIVLSEGVELLLGPERTDLGPLAGTGTVHASEASDPAWFGGRSEEQRRRLEWLVRGEGEVAVRVQHPRAGVVEALSAGEEPPQAAPAPPPPPAYAARIMAARSAAPPPAAPPPVAPPAPAAARPTPPPPPTRPVAPPSRPPAPTVRPPAAATPTVPSRPAAPARPATPPAVTPTARPAAPPGAARPAAGTRPPATPAARPPAAQEPPLAPPASPTPGYRPAARVESVASGEEAPRTVYRVTPPGSAPGRGVTPAAAPPAMTEGVFPSREDSPLRKERPPQADTPTGRVLGAPPTRPGAVPGRPAAAARPPAPPPVARAPEPHEEEELAPLVPPAAPVEAPTRPRPMMGRGPMDSTPTAPTGDEDLDEAPPSASRIPAPLLLRRPRQPEQK